MVKVEFVHKILNDVMNLLPSPPDSLWLRIQSKHGGVMWYKCLRGVLESQMEKKIWYFVCETKNSTSGIKSVTVQKSKKSSLELYRIIWS